MLARLKQLQSKGNKASILCFHCAETHHRLLSDSAASEASNVIVVKHRDTRRGIYYGLNFYQEALPLPWLQTIGEGFAEVSRTIMQKMKEQSVDYVITADEDYVPLFAAWLLDIPGMHGFHALCNLQRFAHATNHFRFLKERTVFVGSEFMRSKINTVLGVDAVMWYPPLECTTYLANRTMNARRNIGFYSAGRFKGEEIVNWIIEHMEEYSFVIVGRHYGKWSTDKPPHNLAYWGHVRDMRRFYEKIDLLLVPSIVEENLPRVILEAAVSGIPTIGNRLGGISEAVGAGGVLIDVDPNQSSAADIGERYVQEIRRLMGDDALYRQYSEKSTANAELYWQKQEQATQLVYDRYFHS